MKFISSRIMFFVWGIAIALGGLISPRQTLDGIIITLKRTGQIQ